MNDFVNIIKLSVGSESVESLAEWQEQRRTIMGRDTSLHITRMWPKREAEVTNGGSIYWVIKGSVQARQRVIAFQEVIGVDGIRRCGFVLDPELIRTTNAPRRPFQGWRYLTALDAPTDMPTARKSEDVLPQDLEQSLADLGLL